MPANRIYSGAVYWDFISIKGVPDLPGMNLRRIKKNGVDGYAFKEMGFSADPTPLYLKSIEVSLGAAQTFIAAMKNLQGTQIGLYDATGTYYGGLVLSKVTHNRTKFVSRAVWRGGVFTNAYKIQWTFLVTYPYGSF